MVTHLVRWVQSPGSFLYDRSLHYYVQMMSKKAFQQLLTDFRRVGSNVVYASPTRLLLQTSKQDVGNAYAYSQYILKSIQQKPLFHFIGLEIKDYWDFLVWYDPYNYGGKGTSTVDEHTDSATLETIMHWQLSRFLPLPLQPIFEDWVVEYIELMHQLKRPQAVEADGSTPRMTQLPDTFISLTEDPTSMKVTNVLTEQFSKPLKKQITSLIRRQREELLHTELASDWSFPQLPGGSLDRGDNARHSHNPVLELVKALMQVVSLSKPLQLEARLLRKELLALFDVKEFSADARFDNPSASLKFEGLVCDTCTAVRDIDLCRDEDVMPVAGEEVDRPWKCHSCDTEFNRLQLEEKLIGRVQAMVLDWQTQDLCCKKCGMAQGETGVLREHCTCGGEWKGTTDRASVRDRLRVMERVSGVYGLRMLDGVLRTVMASV